MMAASSHRTAPHRLRQDGGGSRDERQPVPPDHADPDAEEAGPSVPVSAHTDQLADLAVVGVGVEDLLRGLREQLDQRVDEVLGGGLPLVSVQVAAELQGR